MFPARRLLGVGLVTLTAFQPAHLWAQGAPAAPVLSQSVRAPKPLIQIAVEVVEVNEQETQQLGITWLDTLHVEEQTVPAVLKVGSLTRNALFADLQALMQKGAADLLANPKLVTQEGTTASFHAGGEIPYATSGSLGTVNVEFKPYGVDLKINPHIDANGRIAMNIETEVSGPDNQTTVVLSGNTVPGILSRKVSNQMSLGAGETVTIAGLLQTSKETTRRGIPGLMQIPVLGLLFSHRVQTHRRTSIVMFVTPTILDTTASVAPAPSAALPAPTGFIAPKNDGEDDLPPVLGETTRG